jgi:hypothetical protein
MVTETIGEANTIIYPLLAFFYIFLMRKLNQQGVKNRVLSDEEFMAYLARQAECSEYDLFYASSDNWHVPKATIERDFKKYLRSGHLPYYVKDYVRKARQSQLQLPD